MKLRSNYPPLTYRQKSIAIATAMLVVVVFVAGCSTAPNWGGPRPVSNWAYAPTSIVVHPLSRFSIPSNSNNPAEEQMIVVHVVLLDGDGFACRGVGELVVTVSNDQHAHLSTETVDLGDPEINRLRFDNVTRSYRVHFNHLPDTCDRVWIRAMFTANGEDSIKSDRLLLVKRPTK